MKGSRTGKWEIEEEIKKTRIGRGIREVRGKAYDGEGKLRNGKEAEEREGK